ncbi:MAG: glycosyltransferase family 4 protein, partial [Gammaproteobacteria bacterium]|nr:glycosyltransferase family 4 protein [Gammaproteobacteria bacterium]NIR68272.1 glycosyltransferase family 4 protein [candidate division Zixibacteria bacterium]NIT56733.1 glycosyltransferase family 4 protein [Fodinibius sp.]NIR94022.1 glycosyltransferase family 4 protein [Gammaproteobacteria bacterium]NIS49439.1 glycosyltransferase family 4 protein [candidate division Zixibacteria bacterium]
VAVIGTRAGGVPEIIEHGKTGLMFKPGDAKGLADCIMQLSEDPALRQIMADSGRKFVEERFSEQKHYDQL